MRNGWTILGWIFGIGVLCTVALGILIGPTLYREGQVVYEPLRTLSSIETTLGELNESLPFSAPSDELISEARLLIFLRVREDLKTKYAEWADTVQQVEDHHGDSWAGAKQIILLTSEVFESQVMSLKGQGMSVDEFLWLEDAVYRDWLKQVDALPTSRDPALVAERLHATATEDLDLIHSLQKKYGGSPALSDLEEHFRQRTNAPVTEAAPNFAGIPHANQSLLWQHFDRISDLDFSEYADIHSGILRSNPHSNGRAFRVNIG